MPLSRALEVHMSSNPNLKIVLYAGDVEVASSTDGSIWISTMAAITGVHTPAGVGAGVKPSEVEASKVPAGGRLSAADKFAEELGVSVDALQGACSPTAMAPFIHLDHKYWESLKQNTPPRGVGSVPGVVLAATLLLLWNRHEPLGKVTGAMCDAVIATIGHTEKNRARSLRGCEWIQVRDDGLRLNPASVPQAIKLASAYVTKSAKS